VTGSNSYQVKKKGYNNNSSSYY